MWLSDKQEGKVPRRAGQFRWGLEKPWDLVQAFWEAMRGLRVT